MSETHKKASIFLNSILRTPFVLLLLLASCTSTYKGPLPDFSKTGNAASEEVTKFALEESFWRQGRNSYQMGPRAEAYTLESLRPVIEATSVEATKYLDSGERWRRASLVGLGLAVGSLAGVLISNKGSPAQSAFYGLCMAGSVVSVSFIYVSAYQLSRGAQEYNKDLKGRFNPVISYRSKF